MADDFMKYLQGNQASVDPYSSNPFADNDVAPAEGVTPFADELPFRFTQFALNPSGAATTGQTGDRMAVARSPFTSGQSYNELRGIRSQLAGMENVTAPGEMPQAPVMPEQTIEAPTEATTSSSPMGLPTRNWDLPGNLMLNGMNPLYAAQKFDQARGNLSEEQLKQLGPMTQIQGFDVKGILGEDTYNQYLAPGLEFQGDENKATQNLYRNLGYLPTTSNIDFNDQTMVRNLASQDFTYNPESSGPFEQQLATPNQFMMSRGEGEMGVDPGVGPGHWETQGKGDSESQVWVPDTSTPMSSNDVSAQFGTRLGDTGLRFNPEGGAGTVGGGGLNWEELDRQTQETLMREAHNGNMASRAWKQIAPALSIALISAAATAGAGAVGGAMFGAGAGAGAGTGAVATTAIESGALASTSATTGATGLAGGMGIQAGTVANIVNQLGPQVIMKGATAIGAALGLPVDNPIVSSVMQIGMSMYSGAGATPTGDAPILGDEQLGGMSVLPKDYYNNMSAPVLGTDEFGGMSELPGNYYDGVVPRGVMDVPAGMTIDQYQALNRGSGLPNLSNVGLKVGEAVLGGAAGAGSQNEGSGGTGGGDTYNQEYTDYQTAMGQYNKQLEAFNTRQQLEQLYEQKMQEYLATSGKWKDKLELQSKQSGLASNIQSSIASNPFYDVNENYTGIQSLFV